MLRKSFGAVTYGYPCKFMDPRHFKSNGAITYVPPARKSLRAVTYEKQAEGRIGVPLWFFPIWRSTHGLRRLRHRRAL
jgi:hypothetical protein